MEGPTVAELARPLENSSLVRKRPLVHIDDLNQDVIFKLTTMFILILIKCYSVKIAILIF